jgi:hypothetical protein
MCDRVLPKCNNILDGMSRTMRKIDTLDGSVNELKRTQEEKFEVLRKGQEKTNNLLEAILGSMNAPDKPTVNPPE